jgi:predicted methyltransferase MtxX (methanogen marker protein 4)
MGRELSYFNGEKQVSMLIFENKKTKRFFVLGTAELGQGYDLEQKKYEAMEMAKYLKGWGIEPYIGVISMRRGKPKDAKPIPGYQPDPLIDKNYEYGEALVGYLKEKGVKADFFNIEFETALDAGVNIILPSIGQVGNAFSRALVFFSENWEAVSMLPLHFRPLIIQHTFKTGHGRLFYNVIIAAAAEAVQKKYYIKS